MNEYQKTAHGEARKLAAEISALGFKTRVGTVGDDTTPQVVICTDTGNYTVRRDYHGIVSLFHSDSWGDYRHVSSSVRGDVYAATVGQLPNMKAITAKKIQAHIDAQEAYRKAMQARESDAVIKVKDFLDTLEGLPVKYDRLGEHTGREGEICGGEIVQNGIDFSFKISEDGYISKKISVHYSVENDLESFKKLSANKY